MNNKVQQFPIFYQEASQIFTNSRARVFLLKFNYLIFSSKITEKNDFLCAQGCPTHAQNTRLVLGVSLHA